MLMSSSSLLVVNNYRSSTNYSDRSMPPLGNENTLHSSSSSTPRFTQNFYPMYPHQSNASDNSSSIAPSPNDTMKPMTTAGRGLKRSAPDHPSLSDNNNHDNDEVHDAAERRRILFGDMPESKRRKFILVDDPERGGARVRVRVMLDQVKMDDMPDAHLRLNAVFPRSYFPRQMRAAPNTPLTAVGGNWDNEYDDDHIVKGEVVVGENDNDNVIPRTLVPVPLLDGSEAKLPVPRMTKTRRNREVALNELGYRMSWVQARTFSGMFVSFRVVSSQFPFPFFSFFLGAFALSRKVY